MKSDCGVPLTGVFSQHYFIKRLSVLDLTWNLDLGLPGFWCILSKSCPVSVINPAQFESVEDKGAGGRMMLPQPGVIPESAVCSMEDCV